MILGFEYMISILGKRKRSIKDIMDLYFVLVIVLMERFMPVEVRMVGVSPCWSLFADSPLILGVEGSEDCVRR